MQSMRRVVNHKGSRHHRRDNAVSGPRVRRRVKYSLGQPPRKVPAAPRSAVPPPYENPKQWREVTGMRYDVSRAISPELR